MADLYSNVAELMKSIKDRRNQIEYQPLSTDYNYQLDQMGADSFTISQRYLRLANSENGVVSCQGFYYHGGCYTFDPPQFHDLRQALVKQGFISLNTSEQLSYDVVIAPFLLNGRRLNVGDKFRSAVWHANRVFS
ncbi:hypothetical protein [Vibrio profundi]|uniref:hypothetical protein n=1 Tax=Vibrio profundi TaxID=1774960 RepID=UPI003734FA4A